MNRIELRDEEWTCILASLSTIAELLRDMRKRLLSHGNAVVFLGTFMVEMKRQQNLGISTNCTGVFFPLI